MQNKKEKKEGKNEFTYFVLRFHLRFQVRNKSCFEILDALKIEKFQFLFDRFGNDIKFLLAPVDFSLPLNQIHTSKTLREDRYFTAKNWVISQTVGKHICWSRNLLFYTPLTSRTSSLAGATLSERPVDSHRSTASRFLANICWACCHVWKAFTRSWNTS